MLGIAQADGSDFRKTAERIESGEALSPMIGRNG
jgi:hypothetical protein